MTHLDNKIKDLLNEPLEKIPSALEWDNTKDGIYAKMDTPKRKKKGIAFWIFLAAFGSLLSWYLLPSKNSLHTMASNQPNTHKQLPTQTTTKTLETSTTNTDQKVQIESPNTTQKASDATTANTITTTAKQQENNSLLPAQKATKSNSTQQKNNTLLPPHKAATSTLIASPEVAVPVTEQKNTAAKHKNTTPNKEQAPNRSNHKDSFTLFITPITPIALASVWSALDQTPPASVATPKPVKFSWVPSVVLRSGTSFSFANFKNADKRDQYTTWKPGLHAGVGFNIENKKGWAFSAGYDFEQSIQHFELIGVDSFYEEQEVITAIVKDAFSGRVINRTTEVQDVKVIRNRNYQTDNTFQSHRITIGAHKQIWSKGNWNWTMGAGLGYTFSRAAQGYTLDKDGFILKYNQDTPIFKSTAFDGWGETAFGFSLSNHLSAQLYARGHRTLTNWSSEPNVKLLPTTVQLGIGLKYRLQQ